VVAPLFFPEPVKLLALVALCKPLAYIANDETVLLNNKIK
jgi:hypothetical protein